MSKLKMFYCRHSLLKCFQIYFFSVYVGEGEQGRREDVSRQLSQVTSVLPPCGFRGTNSRHQDCVVSAFPRGVSLVAPNISNFDTEPQINNIKYKPMDIGDCFKVHFLDKDAGYRGNIIT